jgi:prolyl-tRNA synthetase
VAAGFSVKIDDRDNLRSGFKFAEWELKGVPVRIAMGPRDLQNGTVEIARRDTLTKESVNQEGLENRIAALLDEIQENIYNKALKFREENTFNVDDYKTFKEKIEEGGFLMCHWDGTTETEEKIKEETKATIRCIPIDAEEEDGFCIYSGKPSKRRVIFARAY